MTGNYPDAPGMKFQYDRDGSAGFQVLGGGAVGAISGATLATLNSESRSNLIGASTGSGPNYLGIIFPELRNLAGYLLDWGEGSWVSSNTIETSPDSTNGIDGTWTSRGAATIGNAGSPGFRSVTALVVAGIKAIRWVFVASSTNGSRVYSNMHFYGTIPLTSTPDRLTLWHPTLNQELTGAHFDFGDLARLAVGTKQFRVKNNSSTLTANGIVLSSEALTEATPTVVGVQLFDNAGGGYASTQNIGNLAPGAISGVITLKTSPTITAVVGTWRQRIKAIATNWS